MSSNDTAKFNAAVPLFTATHESEPINVLNFFSNFKTFPVPRSILLTLILRKV